MLALNHRRLLIQKSQAHDDLARLVLVGTDRSLDWEAVQAVKSLAHPNQRLRKGLLLNQPHQLPPPHIQDLRISLQPNPLRRYPLLPKPTPPYRANRTRRFLLTDPALTDHPAARTGVSGVEYRGRLHG